MTRKSIIPVAISATFTVEPIEAVLQFFAERLDMEFDVRFAPFNQPLQTLLDPGSVFARNEHGLNVLLIRLADLGAAAENIERFEEALAIAAKRLPSPLYVIVCPPSSKGELGGGVPNLAVTDGQAIGKLYSVPHWHSVEAASVGYIPYNDFAFAAFGVSVARRAFALQARPYKVVAVDCDNTLWLGICGEDGADGVSLQPEHEFLQRFLLNQREAGMLLAMVSKNNEQDVLDTFAAHPEFPLRPEHFVSWRINWESKAVNIASLAAELDLGLDAFIFLDDNARESAEVESAIPEVLSLTLPEDSQGFAPFLNHVWAFDHPVITEEDRKRNAYYAQHREFHREAAATADLETFIASLNVQVDISPLTVDRLPRAAQLTQRTNQFNTTTIRRTEAELMTLQASARHRCFLASVSDRFGDYGVSALLITEQRGSDLIIDSLLLSCRVLGRGVEHRILAFAGSLACDLGCARVIVRFRETHRNLPARQFLDSTAQGREESEYTYDPSSLPQLRWQPSPSSSLPATAAKPAVMRFDGFAEIARTLASSKQIVDAMRRSALRNFAAAEGLDAPATETEKRLALIWAELLRVPVVRVHDNFFDLGGHSLLAVLLLVRVREEFGIELSGDDVYSGTLTLSGLAHRIEARAHGGVETAEYDALLAEIESLSDDEVRELLEQEEI